MDSAAKQFLPTAQCTPCHFFTISEPWSLWMNHYKVSQNFDDCLYDIVHSPAARTYWANKQLVAEEVIQDVNWDAIKLAASASMLAKRIFITKHAAGMCGVGKFIGKMASKRFSGMPEMWRI